MIAARKQLKIALETHLLPVLSQAGFSGPALLKGHTLCYYFRRHETGVHKFLSLQFEKRGGPQFRVNFSEATEEYLQEQRRFVEERLGPLTKNSPYQPWGRFGGSLHPSRLPYFKLFTWFSAKENLESSEEIAKKAVAFYPEIEAWWSKRKIGPHLWIPDRYFEKRKTIFEK